MSTLLRRPRRPFAGHYDACVNAWNHTVGSTGTESPRVALDWHRGLDVVDEAGTHTCELLARNAVLRLRERGASAAAAAAAPLFAYVAFHMVHEADGTADGERSVSDAAKPTKLLEAPLAYTARFADSGENATRRTYLAAGGGHMSKSSKSYFLLIWSK